MRAQAESWETLWTSRGSHFDLAKAIPWDADPPIISPDRWREASKSFPVRTASSYEGFHVSHVQYASEELLLAIGLVWQSWERFAMLPSQLDTTLIPLLPKPKGGWRPIGIFSALYRVGMKCRRQELEALEDTQSRQYILSA